MSPVDRIAELFAAQGAADYLDEPVTCAATTRWTTRPR
jgi:hypothetical protein